MCRIIRRFQRTGTGVSARANFCATGSRECTNAFGAASEVQPKFTSHSDPASQWTAARKGPAFFSYSENYLIDTDHGVIVDVEGEADQKTIRGIVFPPNRSIRQAEVGSTETMLDRVKARFGLHPERLIADTAYG